MADTERERSGSGGDFSGQAEALGLVVLEARYRAERAIDLTKGQRSVSPEDRPLLEGLLVCASLHAALGRSLRAGACLTGAPRCEGCPLASRCAYGLLWEAPVDEPLGGVTRLKPYAFEPGRVDPLPSGGQELSVRLKLFGHARGLLPHVVLALGAVDRLRPPAGGEATPVRLHSLRRLRASGEGAELAAGLRLEGGALLPDWRVSLEPDALPYGEPLCVEFVSPLQLKRGSPRDPEDLLRYALSRFDRLLAHAERLPEPRPGARRERAAALREGARRARRVEASLRELSLVRARSSLHEQGPTRLRLSGAVGRLVFADVPPEVAAAWQAAEAFHLGRHTTFGFGLVRVFFESDSF